MWEHFCKANWVILRLSDIFNLYLYVQAHKQEYETIYLPIILSSSAYGIYSHFLNLLETL
jgi:hypothetical protein